MTRTAPAACRPHGRPLHALAVALSALFAAAGSQSAVAAEPNFPITSQQRSTAQQVAQSGVALSELAPNAPELLDAHFVAAHLRHS